MRPAERWRGGSTTITDEEQAKIDAYIKKKGISECPATQSPAFVKLMQKRDTDYKNMTLQEKWKAGMASHRPKVRKIKK